MTTHNFSNNVQNYEQRLRSSLLSSIFIVKKESPLGRCAVQAVEMIDSYLQDAAYFAKHDDPVNWLASLGYAHGWLFAPVFLGYLQAEHLCIPDILPLQPEYHSKRDEKKERYDLMLSYALQSVHIAPVSGSPLWNTADDIYQQIEKDLIDSRTQSPENALLTISYAYGVLDCCVRVGLYQITNQSHLFTTEI